jgi:hypothetical protein
MFGLDDAVVGGLASSVIGGGLDFFGANSANAVNQKIAARQMQFQRESANQSMDFQERMSNTSWQRGVADMRAAGVNPMLAFSKGGASTPGGATASGSSIPMQNPFANASRSLSSASSIANLKADLDTKRSQVKLNEQNANTAKALQDLYSNNAINAGLDTPRKRNQAAVEGTPVGKYSPYVEKVASALGDVIGAASGVGNVVKMFRGTRSAVDHFNSLGVLSGSTRSRSH